ncbi:MAG: hypothetical protein J6Y91_00775 [Alphaproteobacteria bacterium]|nr:hypothetical protein [Alphaproteobacteria bacterium]
MNREMFEKHLQKFSFNAGAVERYMSLFEHLQKCQKLSDEDVEARAQKLQFTAYVKGNRAILTESAIKKTPNAHVMNFPVKTTDNLVGAKHFTNGQKVNSDFAVLDTVLVYHPADEHERPVLSMQDIARQLPDKLADRTKAVCLLLEDDYQVNSYNLVMRQYEYKVRLMG